MGKITVRTSLSAPPPFPLLSTLLVTFLTTTFSVSFYKTVGLLVIAGRARDAKDASRDNLEKKLLSQAAREGRPVIALCGGCWQLWEHFGGKVGAVRDHAYNGGMVRLGEDGRIKHNVPMHLVRVLNPHTFVAGTIRCHIVYSNCELSLTFFSRRWHVQAKNHRI